MPFSVKLCLEIGFGKVLLTPVHRPQLTLVEGVSVQWSRQGP